jgi:hypothetical protein
VKIAPHALVPILAALKILGDPWTESDVREFLPVSVDGRVRILDALFLRTGQMGLIGRSGNEGYQAGDSYTWDLNVQGTQRYIGQEDLDDDDFTLDLTEADPAKVALMLDPVTEEEEIVPEPKSDGPSLGRRVGNAIAGHFEYKRSLHRKS